MRKTVGCIFLTMALGSVFSCKSRQGIMGNNASLELISEGYEFTEGPAVDSLGNVFFTDQPNNNILKWSVDDNQVSVFMENAGRSNGLFFDHQGNLIACADEKSELWQISPEKSVKVLLGHFDGKRLNGPNDLWVAEDGGIYLTDPYYQRPYWNRTSKEIEEERVYYKGPGAEELSIAAADFNRPNGIVGSPDGKTLYIADIGDNKTYSFMIEKDGSLSDRKLFAEMGSDGMTIDNQGNVYLTGDGVTVFNRKGKKIQHIPIPQSWTANVTFGGPNQEYLFITAMNSLYRLKMNTRGVR